MKDIERGLGCMTIIILVLIVYIVISAAPNLSAISQIEVPYEGIRIFVSFLGGVK